MEKMKRGTPPEYEIKTFQIIDRLLKEKGILKYAIFSAVEEGSEVLPGGIFPVSGNVLTRSGKLYYFWFDWDEEKHDYTLGKDSHKPDGSILSYWAEGNPKDYEQNEYYQKARKKLGLI